ncbi:restriction endonuclease subunit S [Lactobacillus iners]|uniref:Restriction endonuclease subunit S n=1 Tax=Lactobacillus iners TaxID=147802 RepID=A0A6G7B7P9_9LACO|nr:restriction endonuclease subunit S [Lactobacillus iners]QIH23412.1 restriction endonuclease subunit S [Lactobacillus iners]
MVEWEKVKVGDIGKVITGKTPKTSNSEYYGGNIPFLTPSDDMSVKYVRKTNKYITEIGRLSIKNATLPANAICVSCIGSDLGKVVITTQKTVTNQQINSIVVDTDKFDIDFVYYSMLELGKILNFHSKTSTAVPIVNKSSFSQYEIDCPKLNTQKKIGAILSSIDNKIEENNQINKNLEEQAQSIFANEFLSLDTLPEGWKQASLIDIADYLNGLAMQKYRPTADESGIPVLKIKELRQGCCDDNSELCSPSIKSDYIIHDGDVIFSWSGSLLVDFWCGGTCGLNQHLFKVTSNIYDKWFYYSWTNYYLQKFAAIAADMATTMGHIKREELAKSRVLIPSNSDYERIGGLLAPLYNLVISNRIENSKLATIRDTLLPKLMSGEVDVSNLDL